MRSKKHWQRERGQRFKAKLERIKEALYGNLRENQCGKGVEAIPDFQKDPPLSRRVRSICEDYRLRDYRLEYCRQTNAEECFLQCSIPYVKPEEMELLEVFRQDLGERLKESGHSLLRAEVYKQIFVLWISFSKIPSNNIHVVDISYLSAVMPGRRGRRQRALLSR